MGNLKENALYFDGVITLKNMPMPPSINNQLMPSWRQRRFVKTKEARLYDNSLEVWQWENLHDLRLVSTMATAHARSEGIFTLDIQFYFNHSFVFTKEGKIKKMDHNNRIKSAVDGVSKTLGIDDSLFFDHRFPKRWTDGDSFLNAQIKFIMLKDIEKENHG